MPVIRLIQPCCYKVAIRNLQPARSKPLATTADTINTQPLSVLKYKHPHQVSYSLVRLGPQPRAYPHTIPCPSNSLSIAVSPGAANLRSLYPHHPHNAFPNLWLPHNLQCYGIIPERSLGATCLCDDAHVATRPTFHVRVAQNTIISRRKVESGGRHRERFQGVKEEVMTVMMMMVMMHGNVRKEEWVPDFD
jgi:hypothetical protein